MAFNWKTFQTRTLTAIIFAAVMLTGLLWNQWSFLILVSVIHFGCWWEYLKLAEKIYDTSIDKTIKYFFCICGYILFLTIGYNLYSGYIYWSLLGDKVNLKWFLVIILSVCLFAFLFQNKKLPNKLKWFVASGLVYISLSWGLMLSLSYFHQLIYLDEYAPEIKRIFSPLIPCLIIFSIWINDTMAYIVGSLIGRTPLSSISPKKTWEGTIGGIIISVFLIGFVLAPILSQKLIFENDHVQNYHWYFIATIAAIFGTAGDLLESKLKRMAGVKDSGKIMPGHGGFLDRFDSLLLATPAVWLYVYLFI